MARKTGAFLTKGSLSSIMMRLTQGFWLDENLRPYLTAGLAGHLRDILEYRQVDFFRKGTGRTVEERPVWEWFDGQDCGVL